MTTTIQSVIMTTTIQNTVAFGNARITLWRKNVLCLLVRCLIAAAKGVFNLVFNELCYGMICVRHGYWCCHVHEFNKWVMVEHSDIARYFIVIVIFLLYKHNCISCVWLENFGRGSLGKLGCKMGCCMKKVENHWFRGSTHFHSKNVGEPIEYSRCLPLPCFNKFVFYSED